MPGPIDTAFVQIEPDFSGFVRKTDAGIDAAFDGIDPSVRELIATIERQFESLANVIGDQFSEISHTADDAFFHMMSESTRASDTMADEFQRSGEQVERALEEISRRARTEFDKVDRQAHESGRKMSAGFGGMGLGLAASGGLFAIGAGLEQIAQFGLTTSAHLEQVQIAFQSLLGSVEKGNAQFAELQKFASVTPFTFEDLTTAAQRFDAFSRTVGIAQDQLIPFLTTIGNVVSVTGGGADSLNRVSLALGQISSTGKLTLDNINQINDAMPGFSSVAALAAIRGETTAQVMSEISDGAIDATTGVQQLLRGMQQFPGAAGAMEKQSQTLLGVWSTFTDTVGQALSNAFTPVIPQIKESLAQITPIIGNAIGVIAPAIGNLLAQLLPVLGSLVQGITPILAPLIDFLGGALAEIGPSLAPLGAALGQIAHALAPLLPMAGELIAALAGALAPVISALAPLISGLVAAIAPLIGPVSQILLQIGGTLAAVIAPLSERIGQTFAQLGNALAPLVVELGTALAPILEMLGPLMVQLLDATAPLIPSLIQLVPPLIQIVVALEPLIPLIAQLLALAVSIAAPILKLTSNLLALLLAKAVAPFIAELAKGLGWLTQWLEPVVGWLAQFVGWINGLDWGSIGHAIGNAFIEGWHAVVDFVSGLPDAILGFLSSLPGQLRDLAAQAMLFMFDAVTTGIGYLIGLLFTLPGRVTRILSDMWHAGIQIVSQFITDVGIFVGRLIFTIPQLISSAWDRGKSLFFSGVNAIVSFASSIPQRVGAALSGLWNTLSSAIGNLWAHGDQIGRDLLMGMIHGIENAIGAVVNTVKRAIGNIIHGARDALDSRSPSRVFMEMGRDTVRGYALGVDDTADLATQSVTNLVQPQLSISSGLPGVVGGQGGIVFNAGAINVNLGGNVTSAQAYAAGQRVAQGIADLLSDPAYLIQRRPRTT